MIEYIFAFAEKFQRENSIKKSIYLLKNIAGFDFSYMEQNSVFDTQLQNNLIAILKQVESK